MLVAFSALLFCNLLVPCFVGSFSIPRASSLPAAKASPPEDPHLGRPSVGIAKTPRHPLGPALSYF